MTPQRLVVFVVASSVTFVTLAVGCNERAEPKTPTPVDVDRAAEAYFNAAEAARIENVEPLKFPSYEGPSTREDVLHHLSTKVAAWYEKKSAAIAHVDNLYAKVVNLPNAPARFIVDASARDAQMWGHFVEDVRRAPIPPEWIDDAEIRGVYYDRLDAASEPFKVSHAKPAMIRCIEASVKYQYADDSSRSCIEWLARNYKADYRVDDELLPAPTLTQTTPNAIASPAVPKKRD